MYAGTERDGNDDRVAEQQETGIKSDFGLMGEIDSKDGLRK